MSYVIVGKSSVSAVGAIERRLAKTTASSALVAVSNLSARGFDVTVRHAVTDKLITMQVLRESAADEK